MRSSIAFILNGERVELDGIDPRTTLLDWLREERGLRGTKEGCNEGDCGACTVGITRLEDGRSQRVAINACIQLLPMLDGVAVTTVEALADGHRLHPAQQAMVDLHGSQCGFCTPGVVMSLWSAHAQGIRDRAGLERTLSGNLCRCTGYGPILAAGAAMHALPPVREADHSAQLAALPTGPARLEGAGGLAFVPSSEDELAMILAAWPNAVIVAGATDVGLWITKRLERPEVLISSHRVAGFGRVVETDDHVELGAGARWRDAEAAMARLAPDLGEVIRRFASEQIRASGTVGGNLANGSPIGDGAPPLIALGAEIVLRRGAETRSMPLEELYVSYGRQNREPHEYISSIRVPRPKHPDALRCYKVSKRFDDDISAVLGCFLIEVADGIVDTVRIAFGGLAETTRRAAAVEAALRGRPWTERTVEAALPAFAEDFRPIDDMRASAAYRLRVARNLLVKAFRESREPLERTRLVGHGARP